MKNIEVEDIVIAKVADKNFLLKVANFKGDAVTGEIATVASDKVESITFLPEDIVANLGKKPVNGTAYGIKIEIFNKYLTTDLGKIALFCKLGESKKHIKKAYNNVHSKLEKLGLLGFSYTLDLEVREKNGKMAGMYTTVKNIDNANDRLTIYLDAASADLEGTLFHESGHGIWNRLLVKESLKAKWIESYSAYIEDQMISDKELKKHFADLKASGNSFSAYSKYIKSEGDELEFMVMKFILKYFKEIRRLSLKDIDDLVAYDFDTLKELWPQKISSVGKIKENPISEYAMKNVQEYFCECFRLHCGGLKLPKSVRKLMEKTISSCATVKGT